MTVPVTSPHLTQDVHSDEGLEPIAPSDDGSAQSYYRAFPDPALLDPGLDMFIWVAEPGTYAHEPVPVAESSITVAGAGEVEIEGHGTFPLAPGTLVSIPPGAAGQVRISEQFRALVISARPPAG